MGDKAICRETNVPMVNFTTGCHLELLDLSDNPMTSEVADALSTMLIMQPHLRALNLNDTALGDEGVSTLAQVCFRQMLLQAC